MYGMPEEVTIVYHGKSSLALSDSEVSVLAKYKNKMNFIYYLLDDIYVWNIIAGIKNNWLLMKIYKMCNKDTFIMEDVAANHYVPIDVLVKLYAEMPDATYFGLAQNPNTPLYLLENIYLQPNISYHIKNHLSTKIFLLRNKDRNVSSA